MRAQDLFAFKLSVIVMAIFMASAGFEPAFAQETAPAPEQIGTRWLAWLGSWKLVSDTADKTEDGDYLLKIVPGSDVRSAVMKSYRGDALQMETKIVVDGSRQPTPDSRCHGWYSYAWSDSGNRLLFESESLCPGEFRNLVNGISILNSDREWLDVQLLRKGEEQAISVRRYRPADRTGAAAPGSPRFLTGANLSMDEVIELSRKVPPELIAAVLVELKQPFKINAKVLNRLADSGVNPHVVDLMVALSFPDKFRVEQRRVTPVRQADSGFTDRMAAPSYMWLPFGYWSVYGPYSDWYWGSQYYPYYGYGGPGWYIGPGWYSYGRYGEGDDFSGGRLVKGRGYSRVDPPRSNSSSGQARPRNDSGYSSGGYSGGASSSSGSAPSSGGSSSGSSAPSASPGGYHGGGGSTAKPRD